jgi:hypothetical protein
MSQPNGYIDAGPELYFNVVGASPPAVAAEILATQPGVYAVGPTLSPMNLPYFVPNDARVPGRAHIHSVVRTPNGNDYGKDLLRQHYEKHAHDAAHGHKQR